MYNLQHIVSVLLFCNFNNRLISLCCRCVNILYDKQATTTKQYRYY